MLADNTSNKLNEGTLNKTFLNVRLAITILKFFDSIFISFS